MDASSDIGPESHTVNELTSDAAGTSSKATARQSFTAQIDTSSRHDATRDAEPAGPEHHSDDSAGEESGIWESAVTSPASITSPPYWAHGNGHRRNISSLSAESLLPIGAITMRDNEASGRDERNKACWAKSVEISNHVVVNGSATNIGAFVVWNIRVETLQGSFMNIRKRYSEFDDLRHQLMMTFPDFEAAMPPLPPKSVISKFRPSFLDKRRQGLQYFLNCIMLNPEFSGSPILKDFLFS